MPSMFDYSELVRIRRLSIERALSDLLKNSKIAWRGVTLRELSDVLMRDQPAIRLKLIEGAEFVHCPTCDYWFASRGINAVVPKGTRHDLYHCPLASPLDSLEGRMALKRKSQYFNNANRIKARSLRDVPLFGLRQVTLGTERLQKPISFHKAELHALKLFDPALTT